jgi:phage terminase Nu1 subunit (DNA packaging protein)
MGCCFVLRGTEMKEKPKERWIGPSSFAKYRGVNLSTVKDWIREGKLGFALKQGSNNRNKIDWDTADRLLKETNDTAQSDQYATQQNNDNNDKTTSLTQARTAKTAMEAKAAQLKYKTLAGSLVETDKVIDVAKQMGRLTKESMLTLPDRLSPILAAETNVDEINKILTLEINSALRNLSTENYDFFSKDLNELS